MFYINYKFIFAVIAVILTILGYIPYFKDIFLRKTKPHLYTWLIWTITVGMATIASWYGGGNFATLVLFTCLLLVILVFLLSFKYGTKNIKPIDTVILLFCLVAIVVWWQLKDLLLAIIMISIIDGFGYFPTFRKSFEDPWSETLKFWAIMVVANILTVASSAQYNFLTLTYLVTIIICNLTVLIICFIRRRTS